jgi:hypothetical protein
LVEAIQKSIRRLNLNISFFVIPWIKIRNTNNIFINKNINLE